MTGPDEGAPAGRGHQRAAHADREHVIEVLKAAFMQGRLDKDELDARVGQALASRTYAQLARSPPISAPIRRPPGDPACPPARAPPGRPAPPPGRWPRRPAGRECACSSR
ncbi:MAG: DUF1707 SHOCT-like domain-containing protein [Streptosporangiaceae bacterium]